PPLAQSFRPIHRPDLVVAREALQLYRPLLAPGNVRALDQRLENAGGEDLAAVGLGGDPGGHDYVASEEVFAFLDYLAGMEAHAHLHRFARAFIADGERPLNRGGAS